MWYRLQFLRLRSASTGRESGMRPGCGDPEIECTFSRGRMGSTQNEGNQPPQVLLLREGCQVPLNGDLAHGLELTGIMDV